MDKKKVIATTVATVTAASLLLGGTFAWYNAQNAVNEFTGDISNGSVLHDDFKAPDKDVYVENTGTSALFVRVKLDEYLETIEKDLPTGTSIIEGAQRSDKDTWLTHKYTGKTAADDGVEFHKYYTWTMGGPETEYKPAAVNSSGVVGKYPTYDSTQISQVGDKATSQFTGDGFVAGADGNMKTPASEAVTMEAYVAKSTEEKKAFVGWILDTDGWAYWHEKLASGTATGLLLSQVDNVATPETGDSYYYAINAVMQTVTESDIEAWTEGAQVNAGTDQVSTPGRGTDAAVKFLKGISSKYVLIIDEMVKTLDPDGYDLDANDYDDDGDGFLNEEEYKKYKAEDYEARRISGADYSIAFDVDAKTATLNGFSKNITAISDVIGYDEASNTLVMPTTLTYNGAEYTVTGVESFPADLTNGQKAFRSVFSGEKITFPEKVQNIGAYSFANVNITGTITFPASVNYIGSNAFSTSKITNVVFLGQNSTSLKVKGEADSLQIVAGLANVSYLNPNWDKTQVIEFPARTNNCNNTTFSGVAIGELKYPESLTTLTFNNSNIGKRTPYTPYAGE